MFKLPIKELKLRAWDTTANQWLQGDKWMHNFSIDESGNILTVPHEWSGSEDPKDFIITQYINLKDRNGTEIFEGDIVEHHQIIPEKGIDNLLGTYVVIFEQGRFVFHDPKQPEISGHYITPGSIVIVGNLYENPELVA